MATKAEVSRAAEASRRYPPMAAAIVVAGLLAVLVLPSALNLPLANPSTVPEYAPVPPDVNQPPPTSEGDISSLGLGTSGTIEEGPTGVPGQVAGTKPTNKRCVGTPPRQTEDPMSPPCVPIFEGDNGGATWAGVTSDEIRVIHWNGMGGGANSTNCTTGGDCDSQPSNGSLCDMDKPGNTDPGCFPVNDRSDHWYVKSLRPLLAHFNNRYQTYGRHVHVWIYFSLSSSSAERRADAAELQARLKPFASVPHVQFLSEAFAARKIMAFASGVGNFQPASSFSKFAPYLWAFGPDIEHWADGYAGYVCNKLLDKPVSHTDGNDQFGRPMKRQPRKYAFMSCTPNCVTNGAPTAQTLGYFKDLVRQRLAACGIKPELDVNFPYSGWVATSGGDSSYAARNVARMRDAGVTTILYLGGYETYTGQAADQVKYYPEIVVAGEGQLDSILGGTGQNQNFWRNAWGYTTSLYQGDRLENAPSFQACKEADPSATNDTCLTSGLHYRNYFILFKAIQAAGSRITPHSVDAGMHAIPPSASTDPFIAACYFDPNDYTCVKDGAEIWWDVAATSSFWSGNGCWRMARGGTRFLPKDWSSEDTVFKNNREPCSPVVGNFGFGAGTPEAPSG